MAELKRVATPVDNTMTVIQKGDEMSRPCSSTSISRKPLKKATSEGLISLSPEPGQVKFETPPPRPSSGGGSGGSRCGSAGRVEKKLQVLKKKDEGQLEPTDKTTLAAILKDNDAALSNPKPKSPLEQKPNTKVESDPESSEAESETDSDESDIESDEKPSAPIEMKGEFLKCVMDEDYEKAKDLCLKILLIEPDNSVCTEFHGLIVKKMEQEKEAEENKSDDDEDSDSEDEDDDDEDDDDEDDDDDSSSSEEESESDSDDEFTVEPGLNLIMGGLPIKPQPN